MKKELERNDPDELPQNVSAILNLRLEEITRGQRKVLRDWLISFNGSNKIRKEKIPGILSARAILGFEPTGDLENDLEARSKIDPILLELNSKIGHFGIEDMDHKPTILCNDGYARSQGGFSVSNLKYTFDYIILADPNNILEPPFEHEKGVRDRYSVSLEEWNKITANGRVVDHKYAEDSHLIAGFERHPKDSAEDERQLAMYNPEE